MPHSVFLSMGEVGFVESRYFTAFVGERRS